MLDNSRIQVCTGDIANLHVDVIVNAANEELCGGGGVDGAIHRAAGPMLQAECNLLGRCPPGQARITGGYLLPAKHVIHTVGPIWAGGNQGEQATLAACYQSSLALAKLHGLRSIAFPCIATGAYGYPNGDACETAVSTVLEWMSRHELPHSATFCCYQEADAEMYRARLADRA